MLRRSYILMRWRSCLFCTRPTFWVIFYSASSPQQQSTDRHDFESTRLCSYSLMLYTKQRSNKCQFYILYFDQTDDQIHNLPSYETSTLTITLLRWYQILRCHLLKNILPHRNFRGNFLQFRSVMLEMYSETSLNL